MCSYNTIYNRATGEDIESPRQLRAIVGAAILPPCQDPEDEDCCLCPVDVPEVLYAAGIAYEGEPGEGFSIEHPEQAPAHD